MLNKCKTFPKECKFCYLFHLFLKMITISNHTKVQNMSISWGFSFSFRCYLASKCNLKMQSAFIEVGCKHHWAEPPCVFSSFPPDTHFCNSGWSTFQLKGPWPHTSQVNANPSLTRVNQPIIDRVLIIKHLFSVF